MQEQMTRYFAEFMGTFILVLIGCGSAMISGHAIGNIGVAAAFGVTLMALVYMIGPISGCHINPAVTLSLYFSKKFSRTDVLPYIAAQLLGGIVAGAVLWLIASGKTDGQMVYHAAVNGYAEHSPGYYSLGAAAFIEVFITALLIFAVLSTTLPRFSGGVAGLVIGGTLFVLHFVSIPITNTSANFARTLGVALFQGGWAIEQLWLFAATQVIGAIVGAFLYKVVAKE